MTAEDAAPDPPALARDASARTREPPECELRSAAFEGTELAAQIGSWSWAPLTDEMSWSDNTYRLFGLEPGAITPSRHWLRRHAHPDDRQRLRRASERLRRGTRSTPPLEFRALALDEARCLRLVVTAVQELDDGAELVFGIFRDVTDQRRAEREVDAHVAVSEALASWDAFDHGVMRMLRALAEPLAFDVATLWLARGDALVPSAVWHAPSRDLARFESVTRHSRLGRGEELAGQAWATHGPVGTAGAARRPRATREDAAAAAGLRAAVAVPVVTGEEVLAVVELHTRGPVGLSDRLMRSLAGIGHELGEFFSHRRGEFESPALTTRQLEILQLAADGRSGPEIAERLFVSPSTVKTHFKHIFAKLEAPDRASAVAKGLRRGLIH
jgi:PAS domain S-box-containing protein